MKPILILILLIIFICVGGTIFVSKKHWKEKEKIEVKKDDFLSIPTYETSTTTSSYDDSYWFVVGMDESGVMRNAFIKQSHSYFSYEEAKAEFKKKCFITNIVRVDRETYEHNKP